MQPRLLIFVISTLCIAIAACSPAGPPIQVDAGDLVGAYLSNAPAADSRFRGHTLVVTGISGGVDSSNTLTLIPGVVASLRDDASRVGFGNSVTVKCDSVSAEENAVHLSGCTIEDVHVITLDEVAAQTQAMYNNEVAD
jgi:hypothetical protein